MSKKENLEDLIIEAAKDGRIPCALLRKIAEETETTYKIAGKTADELKIKIKNCDLGCF
jgi:LAO/AO transport system kinase